MDADDERYKEQLRHTLAIDFGGACATVRMLPTAPLSHDDSVSGDDASTGGEGDSSGEEGEGAGAGGETLARSD